MRNANLYYAGTAVFFQVLIFFRNQQAKYHYPYYKYIVLRICFGDILQLTDYLLFPQFEAEQ